MCTFSDICENSEQLDTPFPQLFWCLALDIILPKELSNSPVELHHNKKGGEIAVIQRM